MGYALIILLFLSLTSQAATFYVATNGNNTTGDGSIGNPWLTIRKGAVTMNGSDTLNIRGGTYPDDGFQLEEIKSGLSAASPTIIQSFPGEYAAYVPHAPSGRDAHGILLSSKSNIWLSSFRLDANGCVSDGIKLEQGTTNVVLTNMYVHGCPHGMGILATGVSEGDFMGSKIVNSQVVTNGWNASIADPPLHQIYIQTSSMTVSGSYLQGANNAFDGTIGIHYFGSTSTNGQFFNNFITNCNTGILLGSTFGSNALAYNNVILGSMGFGISVAGMRDVWILNNTCYTNNAQINVANSTNVFVENNIVVGGFANNPGGIFIQNNSSNVFVRNNLGYGSTVAGVQTFDFRTANSQSITTNANLFTYVSIDGTPAGPNNIYAANFTSIPDGNMRVTPPSDAIGTGRDESAIFTTDYIGATRTVPWDIGAFEFFPPNAIIRGATIRGATIR